MRSFLAGCLLIAGPLAAAAQVQPAGTWSPEAPGPYFEGAASCTEGEYLYLVGAYQPGASLSNQPSDYSRLRRYDPVSNSWVSLPDLPVPLLYHGVGCYSGRIYTFGGFAVGASSQWTAAIRSFDIATETWTTETATLAAPRYNVSVGGIAHRFYITGGTTQSAVFNSTNEEFNAITGSVAARAPLPRALTYHVSCAVPSLNRMYVIGGRINSNSMNFAVPDTYEFTLPTVQNPNGLWKSRTPLQDANGVLQARSWSAGFALGNRVYLTGGANSNSSVGVYSSQTWEYSPFSDAWTQRANMSNQPQVGAVTPGQRYGHASADIGGKGYVYGGYPSPLSGEEFTPPDFGSSPNPPADVQQIGPLATTSLQAKADASTVDGWISENQIAFRATVSDPDINQQVRLRIQVKPAEHDWAQSEFVAEVDSGLAAQGQITAVYDIPQDGAYDWRWRVQDAFDNPYPLAMDDEDSGWIEAFGNANSPDFRAGPAPAFSPQATGSGVFGGGDGHKGRCDQSAGSGPGMWPPLIFGAAFLAGQIRRRPRRVPARRPV